MGVAVGEAVQLGNRGDALVLVDATGASIDQVAYKADMGSDRAAPSALGAEATTIGNAAAASGMDPLGHVPSMAITSRSIDSVSGGSPRRSMR
jgi:hypothetical protein